MPQRAQPDEAFVIFLACAHARKLCHTWGDEPKLGPKQQLEAVADGRVCVYGLVVQHNEQRTPTGGFFVWQLALSLQGVTALLLVTPCPNAGEVNMPRVPANYDHP